MAAAIAAPSADNRPVFDLRASGDTLSLFASPELRAASVGHRVLGLISIGAAAENIVLRAARLGVISNSGWQLNDWPNPCVAQLTCCEGDSAEDSLERAIPLRHSNRHLFFRGPVLSECLQNKFSECADGISGVQLAWLDTPTRLPRHEIRTELRPMVRHRCRSVFAQQNRPRREPEPAWFHLSSAAS